MEAAVPGKYSFFVLMNATPAWLRLSREERRAFNAEILGPILARYPSVKARLYDAEAFSGRCSDIAVFETEEIQAYYFLIEALRDSPVYTVPYFEIVEIIPAIEGGFEAYESSQNP
jgi:hypothetical protein